MLRDLVANGRTKELSGFRSKAGKPFRAMLVLDPQADRTVTFEFKPRPQRGAKNGSSGNEEEPAEVAG